MPPANPFHPFDASRADVPSAPAVLLSAVFSALFIVMAALVAALAPSAASAQTGEPGGGALLLAGCLGAGVVAHRRRQETR